MVEPMNVFITITGIVILIIYIIRKINDYDMVDITPNCTVRLNSFDTNEDNKFYEIEFYYNEHLVAKISNRGFINCDLQFKIKKNLGGGFKIMSTPSMLDNWDAD